MDDPGHQRDVQDHLRVHEIVARFATQKMGEPERRRRNRQGDKKHDRCNEGRFRIDRKPTDEGGNQNAREQCESPEVEPTK